MSNPGRQRGGQSGRGAGGARGGGRGSSRGPSQASHSRGGARAGPRVFQPTDGHGPALDSSVQALESNLVPGGKGSSDLSRLAIAHQYPYRPGYGTRGMPVMLWTNYFQIILDQGVSLFRYNVDIDPEVHNRRLKARVIWLFLADSPISTVAPGIASDYQANVIAVRRLTATEMDATVKYRDEDEETPSASAKEYRLRLQETGSFEVADLMDYLTSSNIGAALKDQSQFIQVLNIVFNHFPKSRSPSASASTRQNIHFAVKGPSAEGWDLGAGLQAWRGYFTSIRTAAARLLINVQVKHTSMYKSARLDVVINEFRKQSGNDISKLNRFLRGVRIDRLHLQRKKASKSSSPKTIYGLASPRDGFNLSNPPRVPAIGANAKQVQFFLGENAPSSLQSNTYVTVFDYFNKVYQTTPNTGLPVVNVGTGEMPNYLPAEVCFVLPAQPTRAKLSPEQTAQMIRFAVRNPADNCKSINDVGLTEIGLKSPLNSIAAAFGLKSKPQMLAIQGRILPTPSMKYAQNGLVTPKFGAWNMAGLSFSKGAILDKWSILWLQSNTSKDPWENQPTALVETLKEFHETLNKLGMKCSPPRLPGKNVTIGQGSDELAIEDGLKTLLSYKRNEKLLLVIMPHPDDALYNVIKRCGDVQFGIHTACVVASKFAQPNNVGYFANVALKLNLKLGGLNQTLDASKLGFIAHGKTMIVGIDVTHPSPGSDESAPSVAAMVASVDRNLGQFPAILDAQKSQQEMVTDLTNMLKSRLNMWQKHNTNRLPENVLVYRDGVSEGQYSIVLDKELPLLRQACQEVYPPTIKQPAITIVVVSKRHSTRFYPTSADRDKIDERSSNPKNGTIVDRGITEPRNWDFYLQAHTALQGTARPAHYFVIQDEIFARLPLPPGYTHASDVLEELTHNLCYMFGRATKSVSYCPPAYYADLVCERGRCYLSNLFSPTTSQAGSIIGEAVTPHESQTVHVHSSIRDSMFYI